MISLINLMRSAEQAGDHELSALAQRALDGMLTYATWSRLTGEQQAGVGRLSIADARCELSARGIDFRIGP